MSNQTFPAPPQPLSVPPSGRQHITIDRRVLSEALALFRDSAGPVTIWADRIGSQPILLLETGSQTVLVHNDHPILL